MSRTLDRHVAGEGTRLFDGVPKSYRLDLVSSTASSNGIVELLYRRVLGQGRCLLRLGSKKDAEAALLVARSLFSDLGAAPSLQDLDELLARGDGYEFPNGAIAMASRWGPRLDQGRRSEDAELDGRCFVCEVDEALARTRRLVHTGTGLWLRSRIQPDTGDLGRT